MSVAVPADDKELSSLMDLQALSDGATPTPGSRDADTRGGVKVAPHGDRRYFFADQTQRCATRRSWNAESVSFDRV